MSITPLPALHGIVCRRLAYTSTSAPAPHLFAFHHCARRWYTRLTGAPHVWHSLQIDRRLLPFCVPAFCFRLFTLRGYRSAAHLGEHLLCAILVEPLCCTHFRYAADGYAHTLDCSLSATHAHCRCFLFISFDTILICTIGGVLPFPIQLPIVDKYHHTPLCIFQKIAPCLIPTGRRRREKAGRQ